jgi:hypothetical protein
MPIAIVRRAVCAAAAVVVAVAALACSEDDIAMVGPTLSFTLLPEHAVVAPRDSATLTLRGDSPAAARSQVRWRSSRPDVVLLDTTVAAGRPVFARGVAAGESMIEITLSYQGSVVTTTLPVTVR